MSNGPQDQAAESGRLRDLLLTISEDRGAVMKKSVKVLDLKWWLNGDSTGCTGDSMMIS